MFFLSKLVLLIVTLFKLTSSNESREIGMHDDMVLYRPADHVLANCIVSIRYASARKIIGDNHYCAGVLVSPELVLTAAQCLINSHGVPRFHKMYVVAGSPFLFKVVETTRVHKVRASRIHPKYDPQTRLYDLAVVALEKKVEQNSALILPLRSRLPHHGDICTILGWGPLYANGPRAFELLYIDLVILERAYCRTERPVLSAIFCLNGVNKYGEAVWRADSGSPLICDGELTGIINAGDPDQTTPILFSSIYESQSWISMMILAASKSCITCHFNAIYSFIFIIRLLL